MTDLTDPQRVLLQAAADAPDGTIEPPAGRVAASLIRKHLMIMTPAAEGRSRLLITREGRAALATLEGQAAEGGCDDMETSSKLDSVSTKAESPQAQVRPNAAAPNGKPRTNKTMALVGLLRREDGASLSELMEATGWQADSVRGALASQIKKRMNLNVASQKRDGVRIYRVTAAAGQ